MEKGLTNSKDGEDNGKARGPVEKPLAHRINRRDAEPRCLAANNTYQIEA